MGQKVRGGRGLAGRSMRSPGRPPVGRVEHRRWFWKRSLAGLPARRLRRRPGCRGRSASGGFVRVAGCRRSRWARRRRGISVSRSVRRSRCCVPRAAGCGRSRGGWAARRRRSRGSCAATPPRAAAGWITALRRRSGMPSCGPPPQAGEARDNDRLREYVQERLAGSSAAPRRARLPARGSLGTGGVTDAARTAAGVAAWSPEQISDRLRVGLPR